MKDHNINNLYQDELEKLEQKEKRKIEKFKKKEERKKRLEEKRLERLEDKIFAKRDKLTRESKYNQNEQSSNQNLTNIYKISLIITFVANIIYFIYSLIKEKTNIINITLFALIVLGFLLTSAIQKKTPRKITSTITSILLILWMILNM